MFVLLQIRTDRSASFRRCLPRGTRLNVRGMPRGETTPRSALFNAYKVSATALFDTSRRKHRARRVHSIKYRAGSKCKTCRDARADQFERSCCKGGFSKRRKASGNNYPRVVATDPGNQSYSETEGRPAKNHHSGPRMSLHTGQEKRSLTGPLVEQRSPLLTKFAPVPTE
jgi:hypothetical protein